MHPLLPGRDQHPRDDRPRARGDLEEAYQIIVRRTSSPPSRGRVCPQENQCEMVCVRGIKGEPVGIGFVEKFLADWARKHGIRPKADLRPPNGKPIAIIGSGPAGLSAAAELIRLGYKVHDLRGPAPPGRSAPLRDPRVPPAQGDRRLRDRQPAVPRGRDRLNTLVGRTITMDELIKDSSTRSSSAPAPDSPTS